MRMKCEINYSIKNKNWNDAYNMQLTKHNTNDDVDARNSDDRVVHMHWNCTHLCSQLLVIFSHTLMAQVLSAFHCHPRSSTWRILLDSTSFLLLLPPVFPRLPLPLRAVPWAPLHEVHGKPAPFHGQREWGHLERLHLSHRKHLQVGQLEKEGRERRTIIGIFWLRFLDTGECRYNIGMPEWTMSEGFVNRRRFTYVPRRLWEAQMRFRYAFGFLRSQCDSWMKWELVAGGMTHLHNLEKRSWCHLWSAWFKECLSVIMIEQE